MACASSVRALRDSTAGVTLFALALALPACDSIPTYPDLGSSGSSSSGTPVAVTHSIGSCSLANGLVGWWPGEGNANDIAGTADGAWTPTVVTPNYAVGKIGEGFAFDGYGWVEAAFTQAGGPLTVDFWAYSAPTQEDTYDAAFSTGAAAMAPYFQVDSDGQGNYRFFAASSFDITGIDADVWQHIAITYDGTTVQSYADGVAATSLAWGRNAPLAFDVFKIGSNRDQSSFFTGTVDEVHIWNRALSASEVATLAAVTGPDLCGGSP